MKYMGSKSRIAKDIVPIIQKCIDDNNLETYIEPFVGGANVIDKIKNSFRYGYDSNEYLIDFWNEIKNGWNPLDNITMTKELYDDIKTNKDKYASCVVALAGLCATYNAKWFGGYAGIVHTKIGTERNHYDEAFYRKDIEDLLERVKILMEYGCLPYTMKYKDYEINPYRGFYNAMAWWCNQPSKFKKQSFREFCESNQTRTKSECAAMRYLKQIENDFPDIVEKYFDMKFEELNRFK